MSEKRYCECFGDTGLHASTHVPIGFDVEHCDLCGLPIVPDSQDALDVINETVTIPRAQFEALMAAAIVLMRPHAIIGGENYREVTDAREALRAAGIQTEGEGK